MTIHLGRLDILLRSLAALGLSLAALARYRLQTPT